MWASLLANSMYLVKTAVQSYKPEPRLIDLMESFRQMVNPSPRVRACAKEANSPTHASFSGNNWKSILGVIGIVFGLLVVLGAVMMYSQPKSHTTWGVIVLVFSIIAFPTWGFVIGSILGFVGGILGIVFDPNPQYPMQYTIQNVPSTVCMKCGRVWNVTAGPFCANCGS